MDTRALVATRSARHQPAARHPVTPATAPETGGAL